MYFASIDDCHQCLGHINEQYIKKIFPHLKGQKMTPCKYCAIAKSTKRKVKKQVDPDTQPAEPNDVVVSDLRKMPTRSKDGFQYIGTIIDKKTRYAQTVFLKKKDEFYAKYKEVLIYIRNNFGRLPKYWKSDGGGEFDSKRMAKLNRECGIPHEMTPENTPKKNGIAERFNRTVIEGVTAMLLQAGMKSDQWVPAAKYFIYIKNRTPHRKLNFTSPYEAYYNRKPHLLDLKVFGCYAVVHISSANRLKSQLEKGRECVFLGMSDKKGAYIFKCLADSKLVESDSATFFHGNYPYSYRTSSNVKETPVARPDDVVESIPVPTANPIESPIYTEPAVNDTTSLPSTPCQPQPPSIQLDTPMPPLEAMPPRQPATPPPFDASPAPPLRRSRRLQEATTTKPGHTPVKLMEHLAQTPPPPRKAPVPFDVDDSPDTVVEDSEATITNVSSTTSGLGVVIPVSFAEARISPQWPQWRVAIFAELKAIYRNNTWKSVKTVPTGNTPLSCRWVFKIKPATANEPMRYKARLVAHGFRQKKGVNYEETFAAVAKMTALRNIVGIAASFRLPMTSLDVNNAFLKPLVKEEIYMQSPPGLDIGVVKLIKALYGLKQAPRLWYEALTAELKTMDFEPLTTDTCILKHKDSQFYILIYVDDIVLVTSDEELRKQVVKRLDDKFDIKDFGTLKEFIGLQVEHTEDHIKLHQEKYIRSMLEKYGVNIDNFKPAKTPAATKDPQIPDQPLDTSVYKYRQLVGSLLYLFATRPDVCSAVVELSRHVCNPMQSHWRAGKRILRYLAGTLDLGVTHRRTKPDEPLPTELDLFAYSDSNWAGCRRTRKSVSGFVVFLAGGPVSWKSKLQYTVALSSCEAEYMALTETVKEVLWLLQHLKELGVKTNCPVSLFADNQAAIALAKNPVHHQRSKHIDIRHYFLRDVIKDKVIVLDYVHTDRNLADIMTKPVSYRIFHKLAHPHLVS
jgi:histone deacetylase 1/2